MFWTKKDRPYEDPRDVWSRHLKEERKKLSADEHAEGEGMAMLWLAGLVAIPCFVYLFITSIF